MDNLQRERPSKLEHYLNRAKVTAERSTCLRRKVGAVIINDSSAYRADHMPYGGVKSSGVGREGVRFAMEEMTEVKFAAIRLPEG